jgi:hypothetical protein
MNELFNIPEWQRYGYYSEEAYQHFLNRQIKVMLGYLSTFKSWEDYYALKQRFYIYDTQKHQSLFHPWRKQTLMEMKPQR